VRAGVEKFVADASGHHQRTRWVNDIDELDEYQNDGYLLTPPEAHYRRLETQRASIVRNDDGEALPKQSMRLRNRYVYHYFDHIAMELDANSKVGKILMSDWAKSHHVKLLQWQVSQATIAPPVGFSKGRQFAVKGPSPGPSKLRSE